MAIKDNKMYYIEDDIKKIQMKTNMYMQQYGPEGEFHKYREVAQNCIDECSDQNSPGDTIITDLYDDNKAVVSDNGRGFNEAELPMDIFCTKIQAGSKMFRDQGGTSSGEFGLGLTAVNALSDKFILESYREDKLTKHVIEFAEGTKTSDVFDGQKKDDKVHGTTVTFTTSKKYLGKTAKLPVQDIIKWTEKMSYLINDKMTLAINVYKNGKKVEKYKWKSQPFSKMMTDRFKGSAMFPQTDFHITTHVIEKIQKYDKEMRPTGKFENVKKRIDLDVSFSYRESESMEHIVDSYCNYTNTTDNGVHYKAFIETYCRFMQKAVTDSMTKQQQEKWTVTWDDIRTGLVCYINLDSDAQVGFVGNAKKEIGNEDLVPPIKEELQKLLEDWASKNPKIFKAYVEFIKTTTRTRIEAAKMRSASKTSRYSNLQYHTMKKVIMCHNNPNQFREVFFVEGDSASGSARNGRDPKTQAFVLFKGVTKNPYKCSFEDMMSNEEWKLTNNVLGCGVGKSCNPDKLLWSRVNIFTDEDVDGAGIAAGMLGYLYKYMRPIIEAGYVYRVFTPLYKIKDPSVKNGYYFLKNRHELIEKFFKKVKKAYDIIPRLTDVQFDKDDLFEFLDDTNDYLTNLKYVAKDLGDINLKLAEAILAILVMSGRVRTAEDHDNLNEVFNDQEFIKLAMSHIQTIFPEIYIEKGLIRGVAEKEVLIKITDKTIKHAKELLPIYSKYGWKFDQITKSTGTGKTVVLADLLQNLSVYYPNIVLRYKGLGELNGKDLHETALSMDNRYSVQYTVEDVEKELAVFEKLMGPTEQNKRDRAAMMAKYEIRRVDLDN